MPTGTNTMTEVPETTEKKLMENAGYLVLLLIMFGQALTMVNLLVGQLTYLAANLLGVWRCFALERPRADKVKDIACVALTSVILIMFLF